MKAYTMSARALTENGNQLKEVFLEKMVNEKIITEEQQNKMNEYCFVVAEKGFFGKLWNRIYWNTDEQDDMKIIVVKIIK